MWQLNFFPVPPVFKRDGRIGDALCWVFCPEDV